LPTLKADSRGEARRSA